ncbi:MAG TPA: glycosyltransferase family 39 protein, partial [Bryobacteraceae bacterium]|nr:glycosyltransferase family 39 protein [Bryobacteraceae bacterium]
MIVLILGLFAVHLRHAALVHLNPDEALHYQLAHQQSLHDAYLANNTNAHPPLLILAVHLWIKIAAAEWFLRLIPVLAYCGMVWFGFAWGRLALGNVAAVAMAAVLALAPPVFNLAVELRHYTLALCFSMGALYFLERAFAEKSRRSMALSSMMLYLAILSHYSVLWFALGLGLYALFRICRRELPRRPAIIWAAGQSGAILLYGFLYLTHIRHLKDTGMAAEARAGWLRTHYFLPGDDLLEFLGRNTVDLFQYLFGSDFAAWIGVLLIAIGIALLVAGKGPPARPLLLAMGGTFLGWWAAAGMGLYPYGGTRHSIILLTWLAVAIAVAANALLRERPMLAGALILAAGCLWRASVIPETSVYPVAEQRREFPVKAMEYLRSRVPAGGLVFVDYQSALLLCYYLDPRKYCVNTSGGHFWNYGMDSMRVAVSQKWSLDASEFARELQELKREYSLGRGAEVWVFDGGWGSPVNRMLQIQ